MKKIPALPLQCCTKYDATVANSKMKLAFDVELGSKLDAKIDFGVELEMLLGDSSRSFNDPIWINDSLITSPVKLDSFNCDSFSG